MTLEQVLEEETTDMADVDVLVVGAGLFGCIIGKTLERAGRDVTYIDARRPNAGSIPAACLIRPSWLSKMDSNEHGIALRQLDDLYGLQDLDFYIGPKRVTVHWVPPKTILGNPNVITGIVTNIIGEGAPPPKLRYIADVTVKGSPYKVRAKTVIVAAGFWTTKLAHIEEGTLTGLAGSAFIWRNNRAAHNYISVWAPYKQLVSLNDWEPGTLWVGDGSAIIPKNWTEERQQQSLRRCAKFVDKLDFQAEQLYGIRPYIKGLYEPCYLREYDPGFWVATGGAKNGTAAAAWAASVILEAEC